MDSGLGRYLHKTIYITSLEIYISLDVRKEQHKVL